jgi:hypothetical protein
MFDLASHAGVIARAADHMISRHGRHAADFAAYRSRELRALGERDAAELWAEVSRKIGDRQGVRSPHLVD